MANLRFETCCGCIELKTGCLIIGYLNLIGAIIWCVVSIMLIAGAGILAANSDQIKTEDGSHIDAQTVSTVAVVVAVILLILMLIFLTFTIVFLVGIHKNKPGHVKAYMVYAVIFLVIYAIMFFASFANTPIQVSDIISKLVTLVINIYFLLVIRSYYFKMNDGSRQPAIYNTA